MEKSLISKQAKHVFKNKNYTLLFQGTLTSNIAASLYSFALSFYIPLITDNNAFLQGIYLAMCGVTFVLCSFAGGVLADRWDKVKIVYFSDFIKGATILIGTIPLLNSIRKGSLIGQLAVIFIIGFINNAIAAIFQPASNALIPEIVSDKQLQQANSYFSLLSSIVSIFGIILAGVIYTLVPIQVLFAIIGCLYLVSGFTELFIKVPYKKKDEVITLKLMLCDFKDGFMSVWNFKPLLSIVLGSLFINFFLSPVAANLFPYLIRTDIANAEYMFKDIIKPEMWQTILSIGLGLGTLTGALIMGHMKQKEKYGKSIKFWLAVLAVSMIASALIYYLFIKTINIFLVMIIITISIAGLALSFINIPLSVTIQRSVNEDKLAKVNGIINIGSQGLIPIASVLGGLILDLFGTGALIVVCALGILTVSIIAAFSKEISKV